MKVTQIIQFLLTLVGTIAAVEAYDAPNGYGFFVEDFDKNTSVYLTFALPKKTSFSEINIYHVDYHMEVEWGWTMYQPGNRGGDTWPSWNNDDKDPFNPLLSVANVDITDGPWDCPGCFEYAEIKVLLPAEKPLSWYSDLKFLVSLNGSEGEQTFPVNIAVTSNYSSSSFSSISSTATSSHSPGPTTSLTPSGSAYYHEDHVYFDFVLPKSNFSEVYIYNWFGVEEDYQTASGIYLPSGRSFEVTFNNPTIYIDPVASAKVSFSEDDLSAIISMASLKSSPFNEYAAEFYITYDEKVPNAKEHFRITMVVTSSSHTTSSSITSSSSNDSQATTTLSSPMNSSSISSSSSTSSLATTSSSSTNSTFISGSLTTLSTITSSSSTTSTIIPTPTFFTPYGSASYYEDKVYFDFVFPNANYTRMRMSQNFAGPFTYVLDTVSGVYSPSKRSFDVNAVTVGWGVNMRVDAFEFSPDDISANISWVCSSTSPFAEGVFKFQYLLLGGSDSGGDLMSVTVSSLDASPTPLSS